MQQINYRPVESPRHPDRNQSAAPASASTVIGRVIVVVFVVIVVVVVVASDCRRYLPRRILSPVLQLP